MSTERLAKLFHPNHFIDRWSNDGEVQPISRANVAVQHLADVQRDINIGKGQACSVTLQVARLQVGRRLNSCVESAAASSLLVGLIERYRRQHRVADEFEHMTSTRPQRGCQNLKNIVQHMNDFRSRRHVADPRETAQISVPKHRVKAVDRSALDGARVHPGTCVMSKVNPEEPQCDVVARVSFHRERQPRKRGTQQLDFRLVEAAAAISLFGFNSGAALATVVGVLIEVPVMLSVVKIVKNTRGWYEAGPAVKRRAATGRRVAETRIREAARG